MSVSRNSHSLLFALIAFVAICDIVTSGILVGQDSDQFGTSLKVRTRFLLFCGLWTFFFSVAYLVGVLFAAGSILFSIASHLSWLVITFILYLSGAAAVTESVNGKNPPHKSRLEILAGFAWTDTVLLFIAIVLILLVGTRHGSGMRGGISDV